MRSLSIALLWLTTSVASAQTVDDIADRGACSTAGLEGISPQLAEAQRCLVGFDFLRFAPHPNITLESTRVHPYLQAAARDALFSAADRTPIQINSAFRTLADQYVLFHSGGCGLAAEPGRSNHQSGRALDIQNWAAAQTDLEAAGCVWLGARDPVHFDCPGADRRSDSVLAFQMLWNLNHPEDVIDEDGDYGTQTGMRLAQSPAGGFAVGGCDCMPACEGNTLVAVDCTRTDCGAQSCLDDGAPRCGSVTNPDGGMIIDPDCAGPDREICVDSRTIGVCVGGELFTTVDCPMGCETGACRASGGDGGVAPTDAGPTTPSEVDGCGCHVPGQRRGGAPVLVLVGALLWRRRRTRRR